MLTEGKTYRRPFTFLHKVTANEASSGIVRLTMPTMTSGTGLAYDYWVRNTTGLGRVTAYTSNYIQRSGLLFLQGTFALGDTLTAQCQFV